MTPERIAKLRAAREKGWLYQTIRLEDLDELLAKHDAAMELREALADTCLSATTGLDGDREISISFADEYDRADKAYELLEKLCCAPKEPAP